MPEINVYTDILKKNNARAEQNRLLLGKALGINIMSSPGAGKTTLLEETLKRLKGNCLIGIIEGDMATSNDAKRIRKFARPGTVFQIKTENYGGGCHLDASMVSLGLKKIAADRRPYDAVIIENVGNLICPADFDLGEHKKIILLSVTEGDDKPLKYPVIFRPADLVLITKTDLLPHTDFSLKKARANIRKINPQARILDISSTSGAHFDDWLALLNDWMTARKNPHRVE